MAPPSAPPPSGGGGDNGRGNPPPPPSNPPPANPPHGSGSNSYGGPAGRPPSPTAFFERTNFITETEGEKNKPYKISPYALKQTEATVMTNDEFKTFVERIKVEGIQDPICFVKVNGEKYIVNGHHRLKAAKILGLNEVPIVEVTLPYKGYKTVDDLFGYFG